MKAPSAELREAALLSQGLSFPHGSRRLRCSIVSLVSNESYVTGLEDWNILTNYDNMLLLFFSRKHIFANGQFLFGESSKRLDKSLVV